MADQKEQETKENHVRLNTGAFMPIVGFGTFLSKPGEVAQAVQHALDAGYRHIDCAATYGNEAEIGAVFAKVFGDPESGIKREDVFITSKLWLTNFHPDKVEAALAQTLKDLQLDYLDLYLIHIPIPCKKNEKGETRALKRAGFSLHDTWKELEKAYKAGLCKAIGVSNYASVLLNDLQNCCEIMPAMNQIERHPYLPQDVNVKFIKDNGIQVTAYAPLGAPGLMGSKFEKKPMEHEVIVGIAEKYKKTPAQVLIRWSIDCGVVVIPKSVNEARIKQNFDVFDFKLDEDDMKQIATLGVNALRTFEQDWMGAPSFA